MVADGCGVDLDEALKVALAAAKAAGEMISSAFNQPKSVQHKGKVGSCEPCHHIVMERMLLAESDIATCRFARLWQSLQNLLAYRSLIHRCTYISCV